MIRVVAGDVSRSQQIDGLSVNVNRCLDASVHVGRL